MNIAVVIHVCHNVWVPCPSEVCPRRTTYQVHGSGFACWARDGGNRRKRRGGKLHDMTADSASIRERSPCPFVGRAGLKITRNGRPECEQPRDQNCPRRGGQVRVVCAAVSSLLSVVDHLPYNPVCPWKLCVHCDVMTGSKLLFILLWKTLYCMVDDAKASSGAIYILHIHAPIKSPQRCLTLTLSTSGCPLASVQWTPCVDYCEQVLKWALFIMCNHC